MDSATPKPKARSTVRRPRREGAEKKRSSGTHSSARTPLGGRRRSSSTSSTASAPGTPKGRDARGVRPPPRLPRRGRGDSRQPQAHLGAPKEDGGEPFFRQARPEEAHQARGRDRRRVVAKTSLTVIQRAQVPCKTTVEKPRRSCRGFSLSRVFSLSIELYKWPPRTRTWNLEIKSFSQYVCSCCWLFEKPLI